MYTVLPYHLDFKLNHSKFQSNFGISKFQISDSKTASISHNDSTLSHECLPSQYTVVTQGRSLFFVYDVLNTLENPLAQTKSSMDQDKTSREAVMNLMIHWLAEKWSKYN